MDVSIQIEPITQEEFDCYNPVDEENISIIASYGDNQLLTPFELQDTKKGKYALIFESKDNDSINIPKIKIDYEMYERLPPIEVVNDFAFYFRVNDDIDKTVRWRLFEFAVKDATYNPREFIGNWGLITPSGKGFFSHGKLIDDRLHFDFREHYVILDSNKRAGTLKYKSTGKVILLDEFSIGSISNTESVPTLITKDENFTIGVHTGNTKKESKPTTKWWCNIL